jgi:hypothetical protein
MPAICCSQSRKNSQRPVLSTASTVNLTLSRLTRSRLVCHNPLDAKQTGLYLRMSERSKPKPAVVVKRTAATTGDFMMSDLLERG